MSMEVGGLVRRQSSHNLLGITLGICAALSLFISRVKLGQTGAPIVLFIALVSLSVFLLIRKGLVPIEKQVKTSVLIYSLFVAIMTCAFWVSETLDAKGLHYLASTGSNIIWVIAIIYVASVNAKLFQSFALLFTFVLSLIIAMSWLYGLYLTSELYYLRYDIPDVPIFHETLMHNPNQAARTSVILAPLVFCLLVHYRAHKYIKAALVLFLIVLSFVVITSLSRANFINFLVLLFALSSTWVTFHEDKMELQWMQGLFITALVVILITVFMPTVVERTFSLKKYSAEAIRVSEQVINTGYELTTDKNVPVRFERPDGLSKRMRTWRASFLIIRLNPWFGVGYSDVSDLQKMYGGATYRSVRQNVDGKNKRVMKLKPIAVHGGFLKIAVYAGVFALLAFLLFGFTLLCYAVKKAFVHQTPPDRKVASFCVVLLIIVLTIMNIAADSFGMPLTWIVLGVLLSFASVGRKIGHSV